MYTDKLADSRYHSTIRMKAVFVNSSTYINFNVGNNTRDLNFEIGDCVRISKYQNIFVKGYIPNKSERAFVTKNV